MIPAKAVIGKLYAFANPESTEGKFHVQPGGTGFSLAQPGSKLIPLLTKPVVGRKPALVMASLKELALELRRSLMKRQFPPNVRVCLPIVQVKSSVKLCTGTITFDVRLVSTGKSSPRKRTNC